MLALQLVWGAELRAFVAVDFTYWLRQDTFAEPEVLGVFAEPEALGVFEEPEALGVFEEPEALGGLDELEAIVGFVNPEIFDDAVEP